MIIQAGIYKDLNIEQYHSVNGVSRSGLMHFEKSPFHYWSEYLDPAKPAKEPTDAMIFGNAFHTYVLEHHEFGKRYAVEPQHHLLKDLKAQLGDKLGKDRFEMQKLDYEEFLLKSRHKTILSINQLQTLRLMHESLQKHEQGMALLQGGYFAWVVMNWLKLGRAEDAEQKKAAKPVN